MDKPPPPCLQFSLQAPPSPAGRPRPPAPAQSLDSTNYRKFLMDRRKSYRNRGALGPTIASAPSVEQEDYRTPKPSFDAFNGKSFDFGRDSSPASDSNALVKVSADFLRLNGSRQQFRNLLSARKKLGSLPPTYYTRIDCSHESLDSNATGRPHGPVITVEDTGSQLKINRGKTSLTSSLFDSKNSIDKGAQLQFVENGNGVGHKESTHQFKRNNSRYGVPVDSSAVKMVYRVRSERLANRVRIVDRALILALLGVLLMVIDAELTGQIYFGISKDHPVSLLLRSFCVLSTAVLLYEIVRYHINEIVLDLVDCGADDFRVVLTTERVIQFAAEMIICTVCVFPYSGTFNWSFIETNRNYLDKTHNSFEVREVPVDILLSLLMLGRSYLVGRFMVLHSKQFQDASTRTLAALNRIQVNFSFVMKTVLDQQPIVFLTVFTLLFWLVTSWTFVQCERFGRSEQDVPSIMYSNALWFIAITFMLNGYGDIVPQTHCGRIIAIFVGVVGAIISSILIAVISRNILLTQGQRNVNSFMNDSKLTREHKNAAARVLQQTWHIHKCLQAQNGGSDALLRGHQRRFLHAIHKFRSIKNEMRVFGENNCSNSQQVSRLVMEMHTSMQKLISAQEEMRAQIDVLQRAVRNHYTHTPQPATPSRSVVWHQPSQQPPPLPHEGLSSDAVENYYRRHRPTIPSLTTSVDCSD